MENSTIDKIRTWLSAALILAAAFTAPFHIAAVHAVTDTQHPKHGTYLCTVDEKGSPLVPCDHPGGR